MAPTPSTSNMDFPGGEVWMANQNHLLDYLPCFNNVSGLPLPFECLHKSHQSTTDTDVSGHFDHGSAGICLALWLLKRWKAPTFLFAAELLLGAVAPLHFHCSKWLLEYFCLCKKRLSRGSFRTQLKTLKWPRCRFEKALSMWGYSGIRPGGSSTNHQL